MADVFADGDALTGRLWLSQFQISATDRRPALVKPKPRVAVSLIHFLEEAEAEAELLGCLDWGELTPDE